MNARGTNSPHRSTWGSTTTGMNWTAWNSVRANALLNRPRATPSTALAMAMRMTRPGATEGEQPERHGRGDGGLDRGRDAEGDPVREQQVQLAHGRGEQPLQGAGGALPQHRDAGDQEHDHEGEDPEHDQTNRVERVP